MTTDTPTPSEQGYKMDINSLQYERYLNKIMVSKELSLELLAEPFCTEEFIMKPIIDSLTKSVEESYPGHKSELLAIRTSQADMAGYMRLECWYGVLANELK